MPFINPANKLETRINPILISSLISYLEDGTYNLDQDIQRGLSWDLETDRQNQPCLLDVPGAIRSGHALEIKVYRDESERRLIIDGGNRSRATYLFAIGRIPDCQFNCFDICISDDDPRLWVRKYNEAWTEHEPPHVADIVWMRDPPQEHVTTRLRVPEEVKSALYAKQSGMCNICGKHVEMSRARFDHTVPLANSPFDRGPDQMVCLDCHGDKTATEKYVGQDPRLKMGRVYMKRFIEALASVILTDEKLLSKVNNYTGAKHDTTKQVVRFLTDQCCHRRATTEEKRRFENTTIYVKSCEDLPPNGRKMVFELENKSAPMRLDDRLKIQTQCEFVSQIIDDGELNATIERICANTQAPGIIHETFQTTVQKEFEIVLANNGKTKRKPDSRMKLIRLALLYACRHDKDAMCKTLDKTKYEQHVAAHLYDEKLVNMDENDYANFRNAVSLFDQEWAKWRPEELKSLTFDKLVPYIFAFIEDRSSIRRLASLQINGATVDKFFWEHVQCEGGYNRRSGGCYTRDTVQHKTFISEHRLKFIPKLLNDPTFADEQFRKYRIEETRKRQRTSR